MVFGSQAVIRHLVLLSSLKWNPGWSTMTRVPCTKYTSIRESANHAKHRDTGRKETNLDPKVQPSLASVRLILASYKALLSHFVAFRFLFWIFWRMKWSNVSFLSFRGLELRGDQPWTKDHFFAFRNQKRSWVQGWRGDYTFYFGSTSPAVLSRNDIRLRFLDFFWKIKENGEHIFKSFSNLGSQNTFSTEHFWRSAFPWGSHPN